MSSVKATGLVLLAAITVAATGIVQLAGSAVAAEPAAVAGAGTASKVISFGMRSFDPVRDPVADGGSYRTAANGKGLRMVQFDAPIRGDWLGDLRAFGIAPLQYYPHDTYLVWADDTAARALESWPNVRWQGKYQPEWKLEGELGKRSGVIRNVGVHFYNDGDIQAVLAAIRARGATVLTHGPAQADHKFFDAWIEVDASQLDALAQLPQVVWLEYASPRPILDDEMSSQILARNYDVANVPQLGYLPWMSALGYDGTGVIWSIIDSGVDLTHPDFAGRIAGGFTYPGCPAGTGPGDDNASGGHGTHVAGIVGGSGAAGFTDAGGFRYGVGIAPGVQFYAQNPICVGSVPWPPAGGWQVLSKNALIGGAIGGNASWTSGESGGTTYTAGARAWDQIIRDGNFDTPVNEAFMMVFSAGNSGPNPGTLTAPKAAKNPIITGGTQNYRVSSNIDAVYNASSRGPTQDGRFGITIATPGQQIASARRVAGASQCGTAIAGTSNNYAFCSGTSMAAPHASGTAVVLTDWWRENNAGATPSPAMIKALLVNGAKDISGVGPIPNTTEGWGRVDIPGSLGLDFIGSEYIDQSAVLNSVGQVWEVTFGVPETSEPLKISLAWTDAAAAVAANPTLVNNLDLEVVTNGQTYRGNVFSNGMSTTGGSADTLNNVENVFVAAPGGSVTVRVRATNLPGDGVPGVGSVTDQDFALVCRNCVEEPGFSMTATPPSREICAPNSASYGIGLSSILGFSESVTLSVTGQPPGSTTTLTPNPVVVPGASSLVIGNTVAAAPGTYTLAITGVASPSGAQQTLQAGLTLANAAPAAPALTAPANGSVGNSLTPTLSWAASAQAASYRVELASDAGFATVLFDEVVTDTSVQVAPALVNNSNYWWRVTGSNVCGTGTVSTVATFKTAPAPGDCDVSTAPVTVHSEAFTGGLGAYTTTGSSGASTWAVSTARPSPASGGNAVLAIDLATTSDQRLISPPIALPSGQSPLSLQFWNDQTLEDQTGGTSCWDGGLLEVSTDNGSTWTQVPNAAMLTQPYTGPIGAGPATGAQAWCGDPIPYVNSIVDIDAYAGQTVRFRWRLSSDSTVGRAPHGWYVDDIRVQACAGDAIFGHGFELPPPP
jgi:hypothetical protein